MRTPVPTGQMFNKLRGLHFDSGRFELVTPDLVPNLIKWCSLRMSCNNCFHYSQAPCRLARTPSTHSMLSLFVASSRTRAAPAEELVMQCFSPLSQDFAVVNIIVLDDSAKTAERRLRRAKLLRLDPLVYLGKSRFRYFRWGFSTFFKKTLVRSHARRASNSRLPKSVRSLFLGRQYNSVSERGI